MQLDSFRVPSSFLIPVGALTSKSYSFKGRPWESQVLEVIDFLDFFSPRLSLMYRGGKILKVVPSPNTNSFQPWVLDNTRYLFDAYSFCRVNQPLFKSFRGVISSGFDFVHKLFVSNYAGTNSLSFKKSLFFLSPFGLDFTSSVSIVRLQQLVSSEVISPTCSVELPLFSSSVFNHVFSGRGSGNLNLLFFITRPLRFTNPLFDSLVRRHVFKNSLKVFIASVFPCLALYPVSYIADIKSFFLGRSQFSPHFSGSSNFIFFSSGSFFANICSEFPYSRSFFNQIEKKYILDSCISTFFYSELGLFNSVNFSRFARKRWFKYFFWSFGDFGNFLLHPVFEQGVGNKCLSIFSNYFSYFSPCLVKYFAHFSFPDVKIPISSFEFPSKLPHEFSSELMAFNEFKFSPFVLNSPLHARPLSAHTHTFFYSLTQFYRYHYFRAVNFDNFYFFKTFESYFVNYQWSYFEHSYFPSFYSNFSFSNARRCAFKVFSRPVSEGTEPFRFTGLFNSSQTLALKQFSLNNKNTNF